MCAPDERHAMNLKLPSAFLIFLFGVTVLLTHRYDRLFPFIPIGLFVTILVLQYVNVRSDRGPHLLSLAISLVTVYFVYSASFTPWVMGTDPNWLVLWIDGVMDRGTTDAIGSSFYRSAPFFSLLAAVFGLVTELKARWALLVYPLLTGILVPLAIVSFEREVWRNQRAGLTAALIAVTATYTVSFTYSPIPQVLGVFYWVTIVYALIKLLQRRDKRFLIIVVYLSFSSAFTHKISVAIIFGVVGVFWLAGKSVSALPWPKFRVSPGMNYASYVISTQLLLILYLQWRFLADYISRAIGRLQAVGANPTTAPVAPYTHAVPLNGDIVSFSAYAAPVVGLLAFGGIAWLAIVLSREYWDRKFFVLCLSAVVAAGAVLGIFAPMSNGRLHFYAEPILAIIVGYFLLAKFDRRAIAFLLFSLLMITQLFAAPAMPDHSVSSQSYLTASEISAKDFGEQHAQEIHTDNRYAVSTTPRYVDHSEIPTVFHPFSEDIMFGDLSPEYSCVSYREQSRNIHSTGRGVFVITWDIQRAFSSEFNTVYNNGDTQIYCR